VKTEKECTQSSIHVGLAESLKAQGKTVEAQTEEQQFKIAWRNADTKLAVPEL